MSVTIATIGSHHFDLSGVKEQDWVEYISKVSKEPSKFINLLKELLQ